MIKLLKFLLTSFFIIQIISCTIIKTTDINSIIDRQVDNIIYLKSGKFQIAKSLIFPSNSKIIGTNTIIETKKGFQLFPIIDLSNISNISIKGITIIGSKLINSSDKSYLTKINYHYAVLIKNAKNITIDNCHFKNLTSTALKVLDVDGINIKNSSFTDIGLSTYAKVPYSYDGIYLGGNKYLKNATITDCTFKNIGRTFKKGNAPWSNDGDGIHVLSSGKVDNITIRNCSFSKCSARGVKIQAGNNIIVENSTFRDGSSSVLIPMAQAVKGIKITGNKLYDITIAFGTDKAGEHVFAEDLEISNNQIDNCVHFFRTSGQSSVRNAKIKNNTVDDIGQFFICGRFYDSSVENNTVKKYGSLDNKSFNMAILLTPETKNLIIQNNTFGKAFATTRNIDNRSKNSVILKNNTFTKKNK